MEIIYQKVTLILFFMFFYVKSSSIFNEYAGPYSFVNNHIGTEYCPAKASSRSCLTITHQRRKLPKSGNWVFNMSGRLHSYLKETTTLRVVAATRGSSGRYQSLADITMSCCDWVEFIRPLSKEIMETAGYTYNCYNFLPGDFRLENYVLDLKRFHNFPNIPELPYGFYRVKFLVSEENNPDCYCFRVYAKLEPDTNLILQLQRNSTGLDILPVLHKHPKSSRN